MELRDEGFENVNPGEPRFWVREGQYPAQFMVHEIKRYSWGEKIIFHWKVFTSNDLTQFQLLDRYYNLKRDKGGRFQFGPLHDYRKDWIAANGGRHPVERHRLLITIYRNGRFLVEVVSVREDSKGRTISPSLYWSKISRVIQPIEEGETL
jgi:hypothetical protein